MLPIRRTYNNPVGSDQARGPPTSLGRVWRSSPVHAGRGGDRVA